MARMPWFAFYPADWLSDASLASCSPYARGVWIDLLAVAYQCDPAGILATDGKKWSDDRIARSIRGGSVSENLAALNELVDAGVARRMGFDDPIPGAIYSKRMVADMQERERNSRKVRNFRERNRPVTDVLPTCNRNVTGRQQAENSREEKTTTTPAAPVDPVVAAVSQILGSEDLIAHPNATPDRLAWIAKTAPAKGNPSGWAAEAIRKGYTPSKREVDAEAALKSKNATASILMAFDAMPEDERKRWVAKARQRWPNLVPQPDDSPAIRGAAARLIQEHQKGTHASQPDHQAKSA